MKTQTCSTSTLAPEEIQRIHQGLRYDLQRRLGSLSDADDALQEAWMAFLNTDPKEVENPKRWLYCVALRIAGRQRRGQSRRRRREQEVASLERAPGTDELAANRQERLRVTSVLRELPEPYRTVLTLYHYDELSIERIAARLECPTGTVKSQLSRGRDLLRRRLDRRSGWPAMILALLERLRLLFGTGRATLAAGSAAALVALPVFLGDRDGAPRPAAEVELLAPRPLPEELSTREPAVALRSPSVAFGSLEVRCVDDAGVALASFALRLHALSAPLEREATIHETDEFGQLRLDDLSEGLWEIEPEKGPRRTVEIRPGEHSLLELVIPGAPLLSGRVIEVPGNVPVEGATLHWILPGVTYEERDSGLRTGPGGSFARLDVAPGAWIAARAPDGRWTPFVHQEQKGGTLLILPRNDPGPRTKVVDPNGLPIHGARVRLTLRDPEVYGREGLLERRDLLFDGLTDAAGHLDLPRFSLPRVLRVEASGYHPYRSERVGGPGPQAYLKVVLLPFPEEGRCGRPRLSGRLADTEGAGLEGVVLRSFPVPSEDTPSWLLGFGPAPSATCTEEGGRFRIDRPEGALVLEARLDDRILRRRVEPDEDAIHWTLPSELERGRLTGRLESPRPDLYRLFLVPRDRTWHQEVVLDNVGSFQVDEVPVGPYELLAFASSLPITSIAEFRVRANQALDLGRLTLGMRSDLVVRVHTADGRNLETLGARWTAAPVRRARLTKSRDGRFDPQAQELRIQALAPGNYTLRLSHPDYTPQVHVVRLGQEPEHVLEVRMIPGQRRLLKFVPESPLPESDGLLTVFLLSQDQGPEFEQVRRIPLGRENPEEPIHLRCVLPAGQVHIEARTESGWSYRGVVELDEAGAPEELALKAPRN